MHMASAESAFPKLSGDEMTIVRSMARGEQFGEGDVVFRAGDADIDFFVVEAGQVEILNPTADNARITVHEPGEFVGDIDLLTGRPILVTAGEC